MRRSLRVVVGSLGVLGLTAGLAAVAAPSATHRSGSGVDNARLASAARASLASISMGAPNLAAHMKGAGTRNAPNSSSFNWSGYADTTTTANYFTAVSGSWVVPAVTCNHENQLLSAWVGIDGATTGTVEQTGTTSQCFEGTAFYYSWYEMYPAGTIEVGTTVHPGDKIAASVTRPGATSTKYTIKLTDSTTAGNNISTSATCGLATCLDESVEWIAERPSYQAGIAPLAAAPSWTLSTGKASGGGTSGTIQTFGATEDIAMIDATQSYDLAIPANLNATGNGFKDTVQTTPGASW